VVFLKRKVFFWSSSSDDPRFGRGVWGWRNRGGFFLSMYHGSYVLTNDNDNDNSHTKKTKNKNQTNQRKTIRNKILATAKGRWSHDGVPDRPEREKKGVPPIFLTHSDHSHIDRPCSGSRRIPCRVFHL